VKLFLTCICLFSLGIARLFAQTNPVDSIEREINALDRNDPAYLRNKANATGTLLQVVKFSDPDRALALCDSLAIMLFQLGDSAKAYEAQYRYKAGIFELKSDYGNMLMNLEAYAEALANIGGSDGYIYVDIGNVYYSFSMFDLAIENYRYAEDIFTKNGNIQGLCTIYNNYAQIQMALENNDSALVWFRKSYNLRKNILKDTILAHETQFLMAVIFRRTQRFDSAKTFLRVIIRDLQGPALEKHSGHIELHQEFSGAYTAMAVTYSLEKKWDSAVYWFRQGEQHFTEYEYFNRLPVLYLQWARLYVSKGVADSALVYIHKMEQSMDRKHPANLLQLYQLYADYYTLTGNMEEAYRNRVLYYQLEDSLRTSDHREQTIMTASRVAQLQNQTRIDRQKTELVQKDLVAKDNERDRMSLFLVAGALFIIVILTVVSLTQLSKKNRLIGQYNAQLQEANATKEQFLSVISHDLRSPFNTLIGMSSMMVTNVREEKYSEVAEHAELINDSSRKAFLLLDNLMQWVNMQKETIKVNKQDIPMHQMTEEVLQLFKEQALSHSTTIVKDIRVAYAHTDRNLLQVALRNLVSNAIRHAPVGGRVLVRVDGAVKDVHIVVEDNGKGLSSDELAALFREREGASIARKGGGLGLLLVRQFVKQLDGNVSAENVPTGGARFTIVLHNALVSNFAPAEIARESETGMVLSEEDKLQLRNTIEQLRGYQVYDTTEIRAILTKLPESGSAPAVLWKKQMLHAVYHADENTFTELMNAAN
jgi:signal transduction histidine kinase